QPEARGPRGGGFEPPLEPGRIPPEFEPPPPPPPGLDPGPPGPGFGPFAKGMNPRGGGGPQARKKFGPNPRGIDLERLYGRLQTQRVALDSKIVSVQITNTVLADRLETQRPTLERLRSELVKLQERIPAPIDRKLSETRPSLKDSGSKPGDRDELPELDRLG